MFIYNVGFGSYEESEYAQLAFDQELTPDQLHEYVSNAIIKVLSDTVKNKHSRISYDGVSYQDIHEDVIRELKAVGFQEIKFNAEWSCFGWPSLTNKDSWSLQRDDKLDQLYREIPEELKTRINRLAENHRNRDNKEFFESLEMNFIVDKNSCRDHTKFDIVTSPTGDLEIPPA